MHRAKCGGQLEHEIVRESLPVAFDSFVQAKRRDFVEGGEAGVQQHLLAAYHPDQRFDGRGHRSGSRMHCPPIYNDPRQICRYTSEWG